MGIFFEAEARDTTHNCTDCGKAIYKGDAIIYHVDEDGIEEGAICLYCKDGYKELITKFDEVKCNQKIKQIPKVKC